MPGGEFEMNTKVVGGVAHFHFQIASQAQNLGNPCMSARLTVRDREGAIALKLFVSSRTNSNQVKSS